MPLSFSKLQRERLSFVPALPSALRLAGTSLAPGAVLAPPSDAAAIASLFPLTSGKPTQHLVAAADAAPAPRALRIGAVLSGGQAPGGRAFSAPPRRPSPRASLLNHPPRPTSRPPRLRRQRALRHL